MDPRRLLSHIIHTIVICFILPALLLFAVIRVDQSSFLASHFSQVSSNLMTDKVAQSKLWFAEQMAFAERSADAVEIHVRQSGFGPSVEELLKVLDDASGSAVRLYVTEKSGRSYTSDGLQKSYDGRRRDWYKGAVVSESFVSEPYLDLQTKEAVITLSRTLRDESGRLSGVLGMDIPLESLTARLEDSTNPDVFGFVIKAQSAPDQYSDLTFKSSDIDVQFESSGRYMEFEQDGVHYAGLKYHMEEMRSELYIFLDLSAAYGEFSAFNSKYLLGIVAVTILIVILVKLAASSIFSPIYRLHEQMIGIRMGELKAGCDHPLPRDLNQILEDFEALDKAAKDRQVDVVQMTMHVHERNMELESANEDLVASRAHLEAINEALRVQDKKYADLVHNMPDAIWVANRQGRIIFGNDIFSAVTGLDADRVNAVYIQDVLEGMSREDSLDMFLDRDYSCIDVTFVDRHGAAQPMSGSIARIFEGNTLLAIQGIFRNLTETREVYFDYYNRNRELSLINEITKSLIDQDDVSFVLKGISHKIGRIMSVALCTIRLLDDEGRFELQAQSGSSRQIVFNDSPTLYDSHLGLAARKNEVLILRSKDQMTFEEPRLEAVFMTLDNVIYIPMSTDDNVYGVMTIGTEFQVDSEKIKIFESLADQAAIAIERMRIFETLKKNYFQTIEALVAANDAKIPEMEGHTKRVSEVAVEIGRRMYLRDRDIDEIYIAGLLHDIGKMDIEDTLLTKAQGLTALEEGVLSRHPVYAIRILEPIGLSNSITDGILYHHKRFDLTGEPKEETPETLPIIARIIGAVDDLDAFLVGKGLSVPLELSEAVSSLKAGAGTAYCPEVVQIIEEIARTSPEMILGSYTQYQLGRERAI